MPAPAPSGTCASAVPMKGGLAVTSGDITREKTLVRNLEYSNQLLTAIVESAAYAIISTDTAGTMRTFNQAAERMLWHRAEGMIGKATRDALHDLEQIRMRAVSLSNELSHALTLSFEVFVSKAKMNLKEDHEWIYVRKDGSRLPVRLSVTALRDQENVLQGFLGIAYDISEQKRAKECIRHIALHDVLTGLPNRALLDDRVRVTIERQRRSCSAFALAMLDVDRFKPINDSMGHHVGDRLLIEKDMRVALDKGGLPLLYQPQVDLTSSTVVGVEALFRMRKSNGQFASPAEFISLAKETGMMIPIGRWVLQTACRDAMQMQQLLGVALEIAVNISPRQFMNAGLVEIVQEALRKTQLEASQLELKITENVLMDGHSGVVTALFDLHQIGVKLAIDDFGTGYSSLSYLKRSEHTGHRGRHRDRRGTRLPGSQRLRCLPGIPYRAANGLRCSAGVAIRRSPLDAERVGIRGNLRPASGARARGEECRYICFTRRPLMRNRSELSMAAMC